MTLSGWEAVFFWIFSIGAIFAGLLLGTLAMRTRSIWGGVLIHAGVAISMDVLALRGCPPIGSGEFCH